VPARITTLVLTPILFIISDEDTVFTDKALDLHCLLKA
jgi:hypothetical protein